jgi:hypothetical protein
MARKLSLRENPTKPEVPQSVLLQRSDNSRPIAFPLLVLRISELGWKIHELLDQVAEHRQAVDVGILPGSEQPFLPL